MQPEQPPGTQIVDQLDLRQQRDAVAGAGRPPHRLAVIGEERADHPHAHRTVRPGETPDVRLRRRVVDQAGMRREVVRRCGRAVPLQIDRRGDHGTPETARPAAPPARHRRSRPSGTPDPAAPRSCRWAGRASPVPPTARDGAPAAPAAAWPGTARPATDVPSRTSPRGAPLWRPSTVSISSALSIRCRACASSTWPSSVRLSRRVVRWNKRTSKCCSNCATSRVTADWLTWVSRATAENEPVSATRTKARSAAIKSIISSFCAKMNSRKAGLFFADKRSISCPSQDGQHTDLPPERSVLPMPPPRWRALIRGERP